MKWNFIAIVHTEEEEALHEYIDLDNNEPANGDEVDDADEDPEDELKRLMKEQNSSVYTFSIPHRTSLRLVIIVRMSSSAKQV
ncbi:uncharacterized protein F5891DRAFT_1188325 [Suillus fuscotomentosus]|uniref:Uncharacterized protein n=1 Tax=Suillus fuscotomentosus TaxID=1912939 RepID=A0AAD4HLC2_9AGAM|nr:uncharacterized protein F5891DRAFT_1188325 [Suillus fuscotomentosus]KAG1900838.1 hypothetical protein F5891DRAFT_1188325 [Suillus fuscotomentosus]